MKLKISLSSVLSYSYFAHSLDLKEVQELKLGQGVDDIPKEWLIVRPFTYVFEEGARDSRRLTTQTTEVTAYVTSTVRSNKIAPFIKHRDYSLKLKFADELGPERGSWKGGTVGLSIPMADGLTPIQLLNRFESRGDLRAYHYGT